MTQPTTHEPTVAEPARPGGPVADATYQVTAPRGLRWVPLLPGRVPGILLAVGAVVGIAGPILLWLNLGENRGSFAQRIGFLIILVGLGIVMVGIPLLLAEAARLDRSAVDVDPTATSGDRGRAPIGTRIVALVGVLLIMAGAFLVRPIEAPADGGSSGGGRGQGEGRGR